MCAVGFEQWFEKNETQAKETKKYGKILPTSKLDQLKVNLEKNCRIEQVEHKCKLRRNNKDFRKYSSRKTNRKP